MDDLAAETWMAEAWTAEEREEEAQDMRTPAVDLRRDLMALLRGTDAGQRMGEALLREATGGGKSSSVIRAYELIREIVGEERAAGKEDLSRFSDAELREMLARLETDGAEAYGVYG